MIEAYPLYWPEGRPRTSYHRRKDSKFKPNFAVCRDALIAEVSRLGGKKTILSTNIALRQDGLPYANIAEPSDPGVAIYFDYKGKAMCFVCDQYRKTRENIRAIGLTIAAIRAIERYGSSDMMERAFRGFTALPEQASDTWRSILGIELGRPSKDEIETAFRGLVKQHHPDIGGDPEKFRQLVIARTNALKDIGATL